MRGASSSSVINYLLYLMSGKKFSCYAAKRFSLRVPTTLVPAARPDHSNTFIPGYKSVVMFFFSKFSSLPESSAFVSPARTV